MSSRKLGLTEKYSLVRHLIGTPALPVVGYTITVPEPTRLRSQVLTAVARAALQLPSAFALCVDVKTSSPSFEIVPEIDVNQMVIWDTASASVEQAIAGLFDINLHVETGSLPIWKVWVWHKPESSQAWIGLAGGHMIFDGLSTANFAKAIIANLASNDVETTVIKRPADLGELPASLESLINTKPSATNLLSIIFKELVVPKLPSFLTSWFPRPNNWIGNTERPATPRQAVTHLSLEAAIVERLHSTCKSKGVTLHSLLHAAIAQILSPFAIASGQDLCSTTPMSLRRWLPGSPVQGNYSGGGHFQCPTVSEDIWQSAATYQSWLRSEMPKQEALQSYGMLAHVPTIGDGESSESWEAFFKAKVTQPHSASFEINNLGKTVIPKLNGWDIHDVVFSVRPLPNYAALVFAFATLERDGHTGPMTLSLTRESHVVTDAEAADVVAGLDKLLRQLA